MIEIQETQQYLNWYQRLRDERARARIAQRLVVVREGSLGDVKSVGGGVSELRINYGPGYRVYFMQRGSTLIILLAGGDKGSQERDIRQAIALAQRLKENGYELD